MIWLIYPCKDLHFTEFSGREKMSGTKIAMPHPNSFQSGALSFMSCTSGRESSPLDENDSHQTTEFKSETKKKRFHPLRNLRRMFRRKTRRSSISAESYQPGVLDNPEISPTNLEQRSCSTSRLQEENLTQNLIRNSRLNPGLSLSHDSIFTPDRADSGLSSSDFENSSLSITVLTPPSKECPIKSQSSCSETSLLSIGSSEVELSPVRSGKISDLDLGVTAYKLSHSAAKHKMAVKPRRNHGAPRSRRRPAAIASISPLPITLEVSEEVTTGRSSPTLELPTQDVSEPLAKKRSPEGKISWSDIMTDSSAKEPEERANEAVKAEDEPDTKDEEVATQRSESFFGRFLSRRSDKKKKLLQENVDESTDEKPHFVKKLSKTVEGKSGARKTPNRRQRMDPVEIPSTSCLNKYERKENDELGGKKVSSSVSPPRSYWPSQVTSRSMSPPKVVWPEGLTLMQSGEPTQTVCDKPKTDLSPTKQSTENILKDWKNPNFVKELTDSVSLFAREKSGKREKGDEDEEEKEEEEEENVLKIRRQHSEDVSPRKTPISVDDVLKNKSNSSESVKSSDAEIACLEFATPNAESSYGGVKTPNVYPVSFESIHDGYENIQIIEQVRQEVRNAIEAQPVVVETKPQPSPEREKPVKLDVKETEIQSPEPEVVRRIKPTVSEKPKELKRAGMSELLKVNADGAEPRSPEENVSKTRSTLVERRKSELLLLSETEEKEWKAKVKPLKKQTSFSETSKEKVSVEAVQKSPLPKQNEISSEKTEPSPEIVEAVVVLRKKSLANTSDDQPELMKVFARRSLKVRESEKIAEEMQRSRDSDKENEIVDSPKEDRKKAIAFEREEKKEAENLISKEGTRSAAKGKTSEVKVNVTLSKPEIATRKNVFPRYGRSLSENNSKAKEEVEFKRDSSILEENNLNKLRTPTEKTGKEENDGEEEREEEQTGFKRIQQRKAEWERRAQQGAK